MVELREITSDNLEDVLNLQIFEYQDKFVSSTALALAQAYVYHETAFPFAVYVGDTLVGFVETGIIEDNMTEMVYLFSEI